VVVRSGSLACAIGAFKGDGSPRDAGEVTKGRGPLMRKPEEESDEDREGHQPILLHASGDRSAHNDQACCVGCIESVHQLAAVNT